VVAVVRAISGFCHRAEDEGNPTPCEKLDAFRNSTASVAGVIGVADGNDRTARLEP
jgi:hypothetical protein